MVKKKQNWLRYGRYINLALSFGIMMVVSLFLGLYGGDWLDRRLGTSPIFMILGIFLGVGIGFYSLFAELEGLMKQKSGDKVKREKDREDDE
ncbi:MAG: AtpZ/AtpI family protein [Firmicutes bacterium]|nr:AtpZ/AtpI family protein [Bacillota bacterium]